MEVDVAVKRVSAFLSLFGSFQRNLERRVLEQKRFTIGSFFKVEIYVVENE